MITVFTTAKPFDGNDGRNQLAAIRSWRQSKLVDDIFLMGPSDLPDALREELGILHFNDVPLSELGTPMLRQMYDCALQNCRSGWVGYLNADIILPPNFDEVFEKLNHQADKEALVVGERIDFDWPSSADYQTLTYNQIIELAAKEGRPHPPLGTDYFLSSANFQNPIQRLHSRTTGVGQLATPLLYLSRLGSHQCNAIVAGTTP